MIFAVILRNLCLESDNLKRPRFLKLETIPSYGLESCFCSRLKKLKLILSLLVSISAPSAYQMYQEIRET